MKADPTPQIPILMPISQITRFAPIAINFSKIHTIPKLIDHVMRKGSEVKIDILLSSPEMCISANMNILAVNSNILANSRTLTVIGLKIYVVLNLC